MGRGGCTIAVFVLWGGLALCDWVWRGWGGGRTHEEGECLLELGHLLFSQ